MRGGVRGVILDESALLVPSSGDDVVDSTPSLRPGADFLFRTLQFSGLRTGISYGHQLAADKVSLLARMSKLHSVDCFSFGASPRAIDEISIVWGDIGGSILYLVSSEKKDLYLNESSNEGLIIVLYAHASVDSSGSPHISYIKKLEELPLTICRLNKKGIRQEIVTIGYVMKASRQADFAKRGAFPMYPQENGLMFVPLTYELPVTLQLKELDVVLHKATDEIISIDLSGSSGVSPKITYSTGLQELRSLVEQRSKPLVIDPFDNIYPVLDRLKIQHVLLGLKDLHLEGHSRIRGPYFMKVDEFNEPNLIQQLSDSKLYFPNIVKPQVACGVSDAHSMAIVFRFDDYKNLNVPLPAVIQEYVDHSSVLFKVYVLDERVFYAVKKSTPSADILMKSSQANGLKPLTFDSLKSLPTVDRNNAATEADTGSHGFDLELVTAAAANLRKILDLTIFGFDVVVQEGTGDHVIVDVNYLPSFKEVPDNVAIPAFWEAIRNKFERGGNGGPTVN
ncbi:hypothetical protein Dimus_028429 [Dionaea muscipula]